MRLLPAAVIRLERTLAHWGSRYGRSVNSSQQIAQSGPNLYQAVLQCRRGDRTNTRYAPAPGLVKPHDGQPGGRARAIRLDPDSMLGH